MYLTYRLVLIPPLGDLHEVCPHCSSPPPLIQSMFPRVENYWELWEGHLRTSPAQSLGWLACPGLSLSFGVHGFVLDNLCMYVYDNLIIVCPFTGL